MLKPSAMSFFFAMALSAVAQAESIELGIAVGRSTLDPDIGGGVAVTEDTDSVMQVKLSQPIADDWKLQLRFSDLGEAEFNNGVATLDYQAWSLAAQYTLPILADSDFSFYALAGVALVNRDVDGVSIEKANTKKVLLGVGASYAIDASWAIELEGTSYAGDVGSITLGVNKAFY